MDAEAFEHFEELYQGQYETGGDFAESICQELGYIRDLPAWVSVNWQETWDNALSYDYFEIDCDMLITLMVTYSETVGKVSTNYSICI